MTLFATLAFIAMAMTIGGFAIKQTFAIIIGALFWFLFGAQSYTLSTAANDVYWLTFFASMFIGLVVLTGGLVVWRKGRADVADYTDDYDDMDKYEKAYKGERYFVDRQKRLGRKKKKTSLKL